MKLFLIFLALLLMASGAEAKYSPALEMGGKIEMNGYNITELANGTADQDAATYSQVVGLVDAIPTDPIGFISVGLAGGLPYNYTTDGIDDDVQIQAAITAHPGELIVLYPGYYNTEAKIVISTADTQLFFMPGAKIRYNGTSAALELFSASRVETRNRVINPWISSSTGDCIHINGSSMCDIVNPYLYSDHVCILLNDTNTINIGMGSGFLKHNGTVRNAGSYGINCWAHTGFQVITTINIDLTSITGLQYGFLAGDSNYQVDVSQINIRDTIFEANDIAIQLYVMNRMLVEGCWFESQVTASTKITNAGSYAPGGLWFIANRYSEAGGVHTFESDNYATLYRMDTLGEHDNNFAGNTVNNVVTVSEA